MPNPRIGLATFRAGRKFGRAMRPSSQTLAAKGSCCQRIGLRWRSTVYQPQSWPFGYHTKSYYTILSYPILSYTILYYTILYYTILYYTILYYTILYYTILYYTTYYVAGVPGYPGRFPFVTSGAGAAPVSASCAHLNSTNFA